MEQPANVIDARPYLEVLPAFTLKHESMEAKRNAVADMFEFSDVGDFDLNKKVNIHYTKELPYCEQRNLSFEGVHPHTREPFGVMFFSALSHLSKDEVIETVIRYCELRASETDQVRTIQLMLDGYVHVEDDVRCPVNRIKERKLPLDVKLTGINLIDEDFPHAELEKLAQQMWEVPVKIFREKKPKKVVLCGAPRLSTSGMALAEQIKSAERGWDQLVKRANPNPFIGRESHHRRKKGRG